MRKYICAHIYIHTNIGIHIFKLFIMENFKRKKKENGIIFLHPTYMINFFTIISTLINFLKSITYTQKSAPIVKCTVL